VVYAGLAGFLIVLIFLFRVFLNSLSRALNSQEGQKIGKGGLRGLAAY
jgi:hypothetical protein